MSPASEAHTEVSSLLRSQGAELLENGVRYRTWSQHDRVEALILDQSGRILRAMEMPPQDEGYFSVIDLAGQPGDLYRYRLGGAEDWPDPASRSQPFGVHGPSMVIDPNSFQWANPDWTAPPFHELIIYELHIGAFTPAGTFRGAIDQLHHLVRLGVTAIEIMPVADFPGERNWGYDGVSLYAPARCYGHPDDLRALVDAAHGRGLAVILDVVYNHLGPDGNFAGSYHPEYFDRTRKTPWGDAFDFSRAPVRDFFADNAPYWMREFRIDGFRLDATHAIADTSDRHILGEIAERVHALGGFVVAEDDRNQPKLLLAADRGGLGFDGCWADDFHHVVRVMLTQERDGYYRNFGGTFSELAETLQHGWLFRGQRQDIAGHARGGDCSGLRPEQFIYCISNHDQVGNRAFGERLGHSTDPAAYRAASALLCLAPYTPMFFMGQEWSATTPFQFFTDHNPELGRKVTAGRRREFRDFAPFRDPASLAKIPDPQAETSFRASRLQWDELKRPAHAGVLELYREFLNLRRRHSALRDRSRENWRVIQLEHEILALVFGTAGDLQCLVLVDLMGAHPMPDLESERIAAGPGRSWRPVLSSNQARFGGDEGAAHFTNPTTLVLDAA